MTGMPDWLAVTHRIPPDFSGMVITRIASLAKHNTKTGQGILDMSCILLLSPLTTLNLRCFSFFLPLFTMIFHLHCPIYQSFPSSTHFFCYTYVFCHVWWAIFVHFSSQVVPPFHKTCAIAFMLWVKWVMLTSLHLAAIFTAQSLSSKYIFSRITFKLFFDLNDCLLIDSTVLVMLEVYLCEHLFCKCLDLFHQFDQCSSPFHPKIITTFSWGLFS